MKLNINNVHNDLLENILSYLSNHELASLSCSSSYYRHICRTSLELRKRDIIREHLINRAKPIFYNDYFGEWIRIRLGIGNNFIQVDQELTGKFYYAFRNIDKTNLMRWSCNRFDSDKYIYREYTW